MVGNKGFWHQFVRLYLPLAFYAVFLLFPFAWMLIVSLKPNNALFDTSVNPFFLTGITLRHYTYLFEQTDFVRWIWNTAVVTIGATFLSLICSILIGYALGRLRFRGGNTMGVTIFLLYLVPPALLFIPLSRIIAELNLYNKYWALIFTDPTFLSPFASGLLMGYFRTIPIELEQAALVDGATIWQAFFRIVVPIAAPGFVAAFILALVLCWNEFLYALVFMSTGEMKTVPVGVVSDLIRADVYQWGSLMAAGLLGSVPVAVAYSFFVDNYISGLTAGATKG